jgi:outer membrane immunogenic protein
VTGWKVEGVVTIGRLEPDKHRKLLHTTVALSALLATSMAANAADVRAPTPYAPPPPVYAPPPFTWTGFYVGGNIGGAWRNDNLTDTLLGLNFGSGSNNGVFIGGGHLGFNWQVSNFVLGFERDIDGAANNNNTGTLFFPAGGAVQVTSNNSSWISTVAASRMAPGSFMARPVAVGSATTTSQSPV